MKRFLLLVPLVVVLVGLYLGVSWLEARMSAPAPGWNVPAPKLVDGSGLTESGGAPFALENWRGKWVLVYFGFLGCPDVCPTTLAYANGEYRALTEAQKARVEVLFVSVDPRRDKLENIGLYARNFNPAFKGATASEERLRSLVKEFGAWFHYDDASDSAMGYTVHHATDLFLVDPEGRWVQYYRMPLEKGVVADDLGRALEGEKTR